MQAKRDTYQIITDTILSALEQCGPAERPWLGPSLTMPQNVVSGREYRGSNVIMLWSAAQHAGYESNRWASFRQWAGLGANVRRGEKGTPVLWFRMLNAKDDVSAEVEDDEGQRQFPCARLSWVFNAAQVDGFEDAPQAPTESLVTPIEEADALIAASGALIRHRGHRAYYHHGDDEIVLPPRELFTGTSTSTSTEAYYAVALHELTHWTGHESRCSRQFGKRFGDNAYAFEELVAELGAAFLSARTGVAIEPRADHASYIAAGSGSLRRITAPSSLPPARRPRLASTCLPNSTSFRRRPNGRLLRWPAQQGDPRNTPSMKEPSMTILTHIHARVFDYGRDINGNRIAHFAILDANTSRELYVTTRRKQVGYGCKDQQAVSRFLAEFEGGEWSRTSVIEQPSGDVVATYERDLEGAYRSAGIASMEWAEAYLAAQAPAAKATAFEEWGKASIEVRRLGRALNKAEACAERRKA